MDIFDVHRRDVYNFDQYMDLKKPGFGGNDSLIYDRDDKGKKTSESDKLKEYRRVVKRDPLFKNPHYNSTYKAMSHDVVYKQEGEKPVTYRDPYLTGIATVEVGEYEHEESNESVLPNFTKFINESKGLEGSTKATVEIDSKIEKVIKEESAKLEKLQKSREEAIAEGKCNSFEEFDSISEDWFDDAYPEPDVETEEETTTSPDIDTEEGPENPPRRRINPNPKNMASLDSAVEDLMDYMGISREEAENILAIDVINDIENSEEMEGEDNKMDDLEEIISKYGEGPDCYSEGPDCYSEGPDCYSEGPGCE